MTTLKDKHSWRAENGRISGEKTVKDILILKMKTQIMYLSMILLMLLVVMVKYVAHACLTTSFSYGVKLLDFFGKKPYCSFILFVTIFPHALDVRPLCQA